MGLPRTASFRLDGECALVAGALTAAGRAASALTPDVADVAATEATVAADGPLDILLNSAGLARHSPALETEAGGQGSLVNISPAAWLSCKLTTVRERAALMVEELLAQSETFDAPTTRNIVTGKPLIVRVSARIPEGWTET